MPSVARMQDVEEDEEELDDDVSSDEDDVGEGGACCSCWAICGGRVWRQGVAPAAHRRRKP